MRLEKILLLIISAIMLNAFVCNKAEESSNDVEYFDCNRYSYFDNKEPIQYSKKDSIEFVHFFLENRINDSLEMTKNYFSLAEAYLPRFIELKDKSIFLKYKSNDRLNQYSRYLSNAKVLQAVYADAIFKGKVLAKKMLKDENKCFYFKTLLAIQVEKIYNSYFPLKKNDIIVIARTQGYSGGCTPGEDILSIDSHTKYYEAGDEGIFPITRSRYDMQIFLKRKFMPGIYQDEYCPNVFVAYDNFEFINPNDKTVRKSLIELFNQNIFK